MNRKEGAYVTSSEIINGTSSEIINGGSVHVAYG